MEIRGAKKTIKEAKTFVDVVAAEPGGEKINECIQCGVCSGSCTTAEWWEFTPRQIIAMIRAGMREEVLSSNTPWMCVSCYYCTARCPQNVLITDVMYALKGMAIKEKRYKDSTAPDFSQTFIGMVENYGRSYELGLATRHYLKHFPMRLPNMAPMGLGMLSKKRMGITPPKRIEGMDQLKAILTRAKELEVD